MKTLLGIIIGASLTFGGYVFAGEIKHGIVTVDKGSLYSPAKFYDQDNGIVCYSFLYAPSASISCLHN